MLFTILLLFKILLFMNITTVEYNGVFVFLISTLFILLIFSTIYLSNGRKKNTVGLVAYIILSIILFIDVLHYTYFNALPSVKMLSQVNQVAAVGESVRAIFTFKNALMILDIPLMIYLTVRKRKSEPKTYLSQTLKKTTPRTIRWGVPGAILLILILSIFAINKADLYDSVSHQEVFLYHARDIRETIKGEEPELEISTDEENPIEELRERAKLKQGKHTGIAKDKNLIVLQVEALQNFVINLEYDGQVVTPNLNKLIEDSGSLYFDHYYQLIGRGNTSDAEFVTNNSLFPSMEEPSYTNYQDNTFYGLPLRLKDEGYTSWAFHGFKKEFWNREKAYKNQGYERFISEEDLNVKEEDIIGFGVNDKKFYTDSMEYLKELDGVDDNPFYAFMISLTSHNPFNMPKEHHVLKLQKKHEGTLLGNYLQSIHYADKEIGNFIEMLKKEGLYEDTVIALYGDHFAISTGNDKDKDIMTDFLGYEYRIDEMMNIPLVIHVPGEEINETIDKVGSQMDFYPTIMNIMGLDNDKGIVFGRDLVNYKGESLVAPQTYIIKGSFINDDVVFTMSRDGVFENSTAYDLKTRKKLNPLDYRKQYEKVISEINIGDYIMKKDLMGDILEGKDDLVVSKRYVKELNIADTIKNTDSTFEDMDKAVAKGYTSLKLDMTYDLDNKKVIIGENIELDDFAEWMEKNKDITIVGKVEDNSLVGKTFLNIAREHGELKKRIYPEVGVFDGFQFLNAQGYEIMVDICKLGFEDKELYDFIDRYNVNMVCMDKDMAKTDRTKVLKEKGVVSYIYNVDSRIQRYFLERNNSIQGVFTNKLK